MSEAFITAAVRTPIGRAGGALAEIRPDDLAAAAIRALIARSGIPTARIDDVILGCANQAGFTSLFIPDGSLEQLRWFNDLQRLSSFPENAVRLQEEFSLIDVTELAPRVTIPTIVIHRRGDAVVPFEEGRLLAGLIPNARFVPLEGHNHLLLGGEPALGQFMAELDEFLGTESTAPGGAVPAPWLPDLTARESEVLDLVARGLDNTHIADRLGVSAKTIRNHITSIFFKLQVTSRAQAIVRARDAGLGRTGPGRG